MTTVRRHPRSRIAIALAILIAALALPSLAAATGPIDEYAPSGAQSGGGATATKSDKPAAGSTATDTSDPATAPTSTDSGGGSGGTILLVVLGAALLLTIGVMAWRRHNGAGTPHSSTPTAGESR
jgi:hypothetical protein